MVNYLLMGLCIFFDVMYLICKKYNRNIVGLFAKTLAAFCFITIGYIGYRINPSLFTKFVLIGLVFDGIGDLFLALRNIFAKNINFLIGTISFLIGHITFIRALFLLNNDYLIECIVVAVLLAAIMFSFYNRICHFNKIYTVVGICYLTIIYIMVVSSVGIYLTNQTLKNSVFMIGAILFVSSDMILILYNFSKKEKWMHPVYSVIYFVAQLFISYSLHI